MRPKQVLQRVIRQPSNLFSIRSHLKSGIITGELKISTVSRIPDFRSNASSRLRMALVFACAAALVGWLIYDQIGSGSAISRETTSAAQSRTFDPRGREMPAAPPMPYLFTGTSSQGSVTQYLLAKEDRVFAVKVGAILDGVYRVESTSDDEIVLQYLPLGLRQTVPLHSAPWWPPAGAASATSVTPAESAPLPPAVQRTRSPALLDLSR